ncbi:CRISPR-associated protein Csx18 [Thermoleptolyngbya sp.]|jgi:membrane protein implicated in regulation of membrane protease activity
MYFTSRAIFVRNLAVAIVNGAITLIILLIAPLGLVAVWINTLLVAAASFATATVADRVMQYLSPADSRAEYLGSADPHTLQPRNQPNDIERRL